MKSVSLKDICTVFGDGDWIESKDQSDKGIRLLQTGNVGQGVFKDRMEKARWISEETFKRLRCTEIGEGDVLISRLPDPVGRACLLPVLEHKAITAVDCTIVRFDESKMDPRFFIYYSQSPAYASAIGPLVSGSTRLRISREKLGTIKIPLPSLEKQREIVEKLDNTFAEINQLEGNLELNEEKTNQLLHSMLSAAFSQTNSQSKSRNSVTNQGLALKLVRIGDVCKLMTGGTPSRSRPEYFENGTIKWLVSGDINKGEIFDCEGRITIEAMKSSNTRILPINSVMIALNGQGKTRGTVALLRTEATCNQSLVSISPINEQELLPEFLFHNLRMRYQELRHMTGDDGNDRRGLNMILIRDIVIPLPSLEDQRSIVEKLDSAFAEIKSLKEQLEARRNFTSALRQSLLSNAFTLENVGA